MFIAVPNCMKEMIKDISPHSTRLQNALVNTRLCKVILMNTYLPQDPRVDYFDETERILLLSEIRNMLNNKEFDEIIWTGDINTASKHMQVMGQILC